MKKLMLGTLVAVGMMLAVTAPGQARERESKSHGWQRGHYGQRYEHRGFDARRDDDHRRFERGRDFRRSGFGPRVFFRGPWFGWPSYGYGR